MMRLLKCCGHIIRFFFSVMLLNATILNGEELLDLECTLDDYILETKKIEIEGFPDAFNPSIVRWNGRLLFSFRTLPDLKNKFKSDIYLVYLNEEFEAEGIPQRIQTNPKDSLVPSRMDDPRLIEINSRLYMVYSDCKDPVVTRGGFRVYTAELNEDENGFYVASDAGYFDYEGESKDLREKNWVPFEYEGHLLLAYSLDPHKIFYPLAKEKRCETVAVSEAEIDWDWGVLRGGTQALPISDSLYLSFFHSSKKTATVHSNGEEVLHYVMGAYTFSRQAPFEIREISHKPIVGKNFYHGPIYSPYWHPVRVVFPCGLMIDEHHIWITYGRQDHEAWVAKLDKQGLLDSLTKVSHKK